MIYFTIIATVVLVCLVIGYALHVVRDILYGISDTVQDMSERRGEARLDELDAIKDLCQAMVYGPGNVPTKSAEEIMAGIREQVDKELGEVGFEYPLHETQDEELNWIPNQEQDLSLMELPDHEEDDPFMNQVEMDTNG
jgi:hypothetical protein